jgi:hypothetical protein
LCPSNPQSASWRLLRFARNDTQSKKRNILTISKRELTRLRVGGDTRATFLALAVGALALPLSARQQPLVVGAGLYRVGITHDAPAIRDSKFTVVAVDHASGRTLLAQHAIDVFVDGTQVLMGDDNKSLYVAGALQRYLKNTRPRASTQNSISGARFHCASKSITLDPPIPRQHRATATRQSANKSAKPKAARCRKSNP